MSSGTTKYKFAGLGGQGVLVIGKVIAQAGMDANKQVTWIPAYGPEMRGGTANCSVVISDKRIGSPMVGKPDVAIVMNEASYHKFIGNVAAGGTLYVNASMIPELPGREDIRIVRAPINEIAHELGADKAANIVMLGVMQALTPTGPDDILERVLKELAGKNPELAQLNVKALEAGKAFARNL